MFGILEGVGGGLRVAGGRLKSNRGGGEPQKMAGRNVAKSAFF